MADQRPWRTARLLAILATAALIVSVLATTPAQAQDDQDAANAGQIEESNPAKERTITSIGDAELAALAENNTVAPASSMMSIEVHGSDLDAVRFAIESVGGEPYGEVPGFFVEARVAIGAFATLTEKPAVTRIEQVNDVNQPITTSFANNPALESIIDDTDLLGQWHEVGHVGEGQKIGIIDLFGADELEQAIAADRIPTPAGTFCQQNGRDCNINVEGGGAHGVAVAEIIHNTAPRAEIYLATVVSTADLAAAIEWFADQGVTVINRSETSEFDGPGTGTGPTASLIDRAVELDMVWVSAAGNAAGTSTRDGQNWVATFNDPDGNGFHNFEDGTEQMAFTCGFLLGMRWDDWGNNVIPTDYDLLIYDTPTANQPEAVGEDLQNAAVHVPLEHVNTSCSSTTDIDYIVIRKFGDTTPDGNDTIQILGNQTNMAEWINASSALGPGNASDNPGAVIVGSSQSPTVDLVANFSSRGPTFDGRTAVDIIAPSCLPIPDFFAFCFSGTSASAPVVAGAIAVLRGADVINTAVEIDQLLADIAVEAGPIGIDNAYGNGVFTLPSPAVLNARSVIPECNGVPATIIGTASNDVILGTESADVIVGLGGNDTITSLGGDDIICGGDGNDVIGSGTGNDTVFGGLGDDRIGAGWGNDTVFGGFGRDNITGYLGADLLYGFVGADVIRGGPGNDLIGGGTGNDELLGGLGTDRVYGGLGIDFCKDATEFRDSCQIS